jgi:hypothetical protein
MSEDLGTGKVHKTNRAARVPTTMHHDWIQQLLKRRQNAHTRVVGDLVVGAAAGVDGGVDADVEGVRQVVGALVGVVGVVAGRREVLTALSAEPPPVCFDEAVVSSDYDTLDP